MWYDVIAEEDHLVGGTDAMVEKVIDERGLV